MWHQFSCNDLITQYHFLVVIITLCKLCLERCVNFTIFIHLRIHHLKTRGLFLHILLKCIHLSANIQLPLLIGLGNLQFFCRIRHIARRIHI